ncbi:hypothetical protein ABZ896_01970 [Streptomyces sp. NPDC047072]|uniref:hypothetical protein n=1 Tax=Streptomyces sp. NPDC047072 TaxID=3154809 RepID=UPI0033E77730
MKFSEVLSWSGFKTWISGAERPDPHAVARAAREQARVALPAVERLVDSHVVAIGDGAPVPPARMRPDVFPEAGSTTDRVLAHADRTERVLDRLNPVNAAMDAFDNRGGRTEQALSGDWGSTAGQLACALQPREDAGVVSVLLLGHRGLHVVHVQRSPDGRTAGPAVKYGWGVPVDQVAWFRKRTDAPHGTHDIAFSDGSRVSICFPVAGWGTLAEGLSDLRAR